MFPEERCWLCNSWMLVNIVCCWVSLERAIYDVNLLVLLGSPVAPRCVLIVHEDLTFFCKNSICLTLRESLAG
jgi:hypothetical protein